MMMVVLTCVRVYFGRVGNMIVEVIDPVEDYVKVVLRCHHSLDTALIHRYIHT